MGSFSEPGTEGTTIHYRFAPPRTKRELAIMDEIGPPYAAMIEASQRTLVDQIEAQRSARDAGGMEIELAGPRPDGPLSGLQPLVNVG